MALCQDFFEKCKTTMDVHSKLRELLVCEYLRPERESSKFRMLCKTEIPPSDRTSVEDILNYLERTGQFYEGNYDYVKRKVEDIDVAITYLINKAERRIEEIKGNSLLVIAEVSEVDPIHLEKKTREEVDLILLAVSEKLLCRSDEDAEIISGLWKRYQDLNSLSENFLNIWHTKFCKCRKQHGRLLLLKFIKKGAHSLEQGETEFDRFKRTIAPTLLATLQQSAIITLHVFKNCGASIVSVVRSSVSSYWVFDSVLNLDKLWRKHEKKGLHIELQDCLNTEETLRLLKVDRISLKITIQKSDYLKYRSILEKKATKDHRLTSRLQALDLNPAKYPVETTTVGSVNATIKTTEGDSLVDITEALNLDHSIRTEKTTEMGLPKHFVKLKASLKDPFSNLYVAQLKRSELPIYSYLMKKRLYEINQRLSETPTVLSYLLQSGDKMTRESLYSSVSLLEYDHEMILLYSLHSTRNKKLNDRILCTSDETSWKRRSRSKMRYIERDKDSNTNSTCVIILGEAGCGKTSYCLHLLRQWCQGEELQKFDKVFYVDTSVLQASKTFISELISSAVFGKVTFSVDQVDSVLRHEKCLILIDGDEYSRGSLLREYMIKELVMEYCNCVFVFLVRPLHFKSAMHFNVYPHEYKFFEVNKISDQFMQLSGLSKKGMASLYSNVMVNSYEIRQLESLREIKTDDPQQITKKSILQKDTKEPDTALSVTESYLYQSKGEPDSQAYIAQNPTDLEQQVKKPGSGDFAKEAETKPKTEKDFSKHDRKELEFYKIKGMLEKGLRDNYDFIMKIPMLGSVCVGLLAEGKDLPRNFTNLYLCLIDKLVGGHESVSGGKGEKGIKPFDLFLPYENVHRHVKTLRKLGNIAFNSIFSPASKLVNYKTLDGYLEETEIDFAIRTGLLVPVQTYTSKTSDEQNVCFLHKTIQDSLVSIYIVMEKEEAIDSFCQQLTSMNVIIHVSYVIMMVCGLNPNLGCHITRSIKDVLDKDNNVIHHRQNLWRDSFVREFYYLQLSWYSEYKDKVTNIGSDTEDSFYVSDIYFDDDTAKDTVTKTIVLLSDINVIVTSLYINNVPAESGLSDKVLNDFLALNTSALKSLYVSGIRTTYRSIEPLSFPVLTVLKIRYVRIRPASRDDEATQPLLYHLPMLQHLYLYNIELNNRLLGFTSNKGKLRMLKTFYIKKVDMGDQSIELASDMTDIKDIDLVNVKMSPPGWMRFIRSLVNIHHSYRVRLTHSDIDAKSLDMVRTDQNFEVEGESHTYYSSFFRVWPLT